MNQELSITKNWAPNPFSNNCFEQAPHWFKITALLMKSKHIIVHENIAKRLGTNNTKRQLICVSCLHVMAI